MTTTTAKIRVKLGQLEIDYEGDAAFLDGKLMEMVETLQGMLGKHPHPPALPPHVSGGAKPIQGALKLSTKTIATKLGAKTGPQLGRAAIGNLVLVQGKETFTRSEIHDEMKTASGIYKSTMFGNLSPILNSLLADGTIVETTNEVYALTPEGETTLRSGIGAN